MRVTRIRLELDELKRQLSEWKTVQLSPQFHRVSTRTGDHLNTIRRELTSQISTVEARLKAAESDLLSFPELPSSVPTDIADIDKETMDFTVELERWVTSFTGYVERETGRPSASSSTSNMDVDTQPDSAVPRVVDVMKRVKELEERLEEMDEQIFYAQISFHQERSADIDNAVQAVRSKRDDGLGREKGAGEGGLVCELRDLVDGADSNMRREAERVVLLIESHEQANQRIATLEAQQVQHRRLKEEVYIFLRNSVSTCSSIFADAIATRTVGTTEAAEGRATPADARAGRAICSASRHSSHSRPRCFNPRPGDYKGDD